jgi:hypothetical protein
MRRYAAASSRESAASPARRLSDSRYVSAVWTMALRASVAPLSGAIPIVHVEHERIGERAHLLEPALGSPRLEHRGAEANPTARLAKTTTPAATATR